MSYIFNTFFYDPLYNGLILLLSWLPSPEVGVAVILFTIIVKLILFPLSKQAVHTQMKLRQVEPELAKLRDRNKDDKEKQAREMMAFYKDNGINPFSGFFLLLLQIPVILALYFIFFNGGLPIVDMERLYTFVAKAFATITEPINMHFLGLDISRPQFILALLAGISQYAQVYYSVPPYVKVEKPTFKDDMMRSMNIQIRYVLPVFIFIISLNISGAVALYWITSNLFTIAQELYMRKTIKKEPTVLAPKA